VHGREDTCLVTGLADAVLVSITSRQGRWRRSYMRFIRRAVPGAYCRLARLAAETVPAGSPVCPGTPGARPRWGVATDGTRRRRCHR
jgi:hypothetical protein